MNTLEYILTKVATTSQIEEAKYCLGEISLEQKNKKIAGIVEEAYIQYLEIQHDLRTEVTL